MPPVGHFGAASILLAVLTCIVVSLIGVTLSRLYSVSSRNLASSSTTMQAQQFARSKMDYLIYKGYANLQVQTKSVVLDTTFKDSVALGIVSTDADGVSSRVVTVSIYNGDEAVPRATLQQVFYSNDATKYVHNINSPSNDISIGYNEENDKVYASVDGVEKPLGSDGGVPVGTVIAWPSANNPSEGTWLDCNGQSCAAYPELVSALGKSTVPDYRGRFLEGSATAGTVKEAGLPNITGSIDNRQEKDYIEPLSYADDIKFTGAFYKILVDSNFNTVPTSGNNDNYSLRAWGFDASRSNSIYGKSSTVQPPSVTVRYLIKAA